jgi:hypothetical protein
MIKNSYLLAIGGQAQIKVSNHGVPFPGNDHGIKSWCSVSWQ